MAMTAVATGALGKIAGAFGSYDQSDVAWEEESSQPKLPQVFSMPWISSSRISWISWITLGFHVFFRCRWLLFFFGPGEVIVCQPDTTNAGGFHSQALQSCWRVMKQKTCR